MQTDNEAATVRKIRTVQIERTRRVMRMNDAEYLFKIDVSLEQINEVKGEKSSACMILFHGSMDSDFFHGDILPGGVDTQLEKSYCLRLGEYV